MGVIPLQINLWEKEKKTPKMTMNSSEGNKSGTREYPLKYLARRVNKIAPTVQHFMISMVVDTEIYRYIDMGDSHPWDSSDSFS